MSPQKQAAQVANAALSKGPRTEEGKARSSQNSLRNGFSARKYLITAKDRPEFDRHFATMMEALAPEGDIEMQLAETIVTDQFRLSRIKDVENEIFVQGFVDAGEEVFAGAETWKAHCKELALLTLYEQRVHRMLSRNKQEFEARQAARKAQTAEAAAASCPTDAAPQSRVAHAAPDGETVAAAPRSSGFVRSSAMEPGPEPAPAPAIESAETFGFVHSRASGPEPPLAQAAA